MPNPPWLSKFPDAYYLTDYGLPLLIASVPLQLCPAFLVSSKYDPPGALVLVRTRNLPHTGVHMPLELIY